MAALRSGLADRWRSEIGGDEEMLAWLLERWGEPQRRYHDLRHLTECLDALDALGAGEAEGLAGWFHDVVYDGEPGRDEQRSAEFSRAWLSRANTHPALVREVERLILLTIEHDPAAGDLPGQILNDADLAILGATPERYRESVADIRLEYARFDDERWRAGRAQVLRAFLSRPQIYRTDIGRTTWEDKARSNIEGELRTL